MHWNYFVSLFNCTRDQSTRTHTLKIREHSCFGMLCKIPAAPHIYGAVHKWSSLDGDEVVVVVVVVRAGGGGLLQSQLFFSKLRQSLPFICILWICFDILCSVLFSKISFAPSQVPFFQIFNALVHIFAQISTNTWQGGLYAPHPPGPNRV